MNAITTVYTSRELLWNFTLRELRTKYRRSVLGWSWSMLNPLATFTIYWFVFGVVFPGVAPLGEPSGLKTFALFLLCGLIPWNFFALMCGLGLGSVTGNAGLVRRVSFPREILVFANVLHACVQFAIELSLLSLVLFVAGSPLLPWIPVTLLVTLMLVMFGSGFALALGALAVYFRDMSYLWAIGIQVWFFATPIVYPPTYLSENPSIPTWAVQILDANPMAIFIGAYRTLLYDGTLPSAGTLITLLLVSVVTLTLGWALFLKLEPRFAEEV